MKIAIIGGGISGLTTAHLLCGEHEVTLFEAGDYPGGHTNTPYLLQTGMKGISPSPQGTDVVR